MELKDILLKGRRDAGLTQAKVAKALGVTPQAVSQWERGEAVPEIDKLGRLAKLYRISLDIMLDPPGDHLPSEAVLLALPRPPRAVLVKGYVGAGSEMHGFKVAHESFDEVDLPEANDRTVAVEVRGTSFGPLLDRWLVFYDEVHSPMTPALIGKTCVVGLTDDRILIKKIVSNGRGGYTLLSNSNEPPIENVDIEWAAKVTAMRPK